MEPLQAELKAAKERWGKEIELSKAEKGAAGYPFPVCCTRYTAQPESALAWDVEELPVRLVFKDADVAASPVSVEVPDTFPGELPERIEKAVEAEWRRLLGKKKKAEGELWMVVKILEWVEAEFDKLLRLVPDYVDAYVGCDNEGASMRRYVLTGPEAPDREAEHEEEEDEEEEDEERRVQAWIEKERERLEAEINEKFAEDAKKKDLALAGISIDGEKARVLSKKEKAELNPTRKEKSGQRWRKTPSKSHKPVRDEEEVKKRKDPKKKVWS